MSFADLRRHQAGLTESFASVGRRLCQRAFAAVGDIAFGRTERAADQRNALIAFAVRVASAAILFLSQISIARWIGGTDYGIYVYAWTWVLVLGGLSTLGLNTAAIRLVPQYRETGDLAALRGFLRGGRLQTLAVAICSTGIAALALYGTSGATSGGASATVETALLLALLAVPAYALSDIQDAICRGSAMILSATVPLYIVRPLLILAGIGTVYALGLTLDARGAVLAAVAATWLVWGLQTAIVETRIVAPLPAGPLDYRPAEWMATSLPLLANCACELALQNTDVIVISHLLSPAEGGIYFAAAKTMALIMFVYYAVGSAMANRFAAISARGADAALRATVLDAVRWTFWPSLAVGLVMLMAGRPLLALFGPRFVDGYPVMCVLVGAFLVRAAVGPVDFLLNMSGSQHACARSLAIAAVLNLLLDLALVPMFGIVGAACAVAIALITGAVLNYRVACERLGFDIGIWAAYGRHPA